MLVEGKSSPLVIDEVSDDICLENLKLVAARETLEECGSLLVFDDRWQDIKLVLDLVSLLLVAVLMENVFETVGSLPDEASFFTFLLILIVFVMKFVMLKQGLKYVSILISKLK